jgi:putative ABC transport system substrate-binding protein
VSWRSFAFAFISMAACFGLFGLSSPADAQQPASPRHIGVLFAGYWTEEMVQAFRQGLMEAGYIEGRDVVIEWRRAKGNYDRLPQLAADLVQSNVDVIVVSDTPSARAAKRATSTIPIVLTLVADPVGSGLVTSLAHPGGNVTGLTIMFADLSAKRLQLLKETVPLATRVRVLWNPDTPYHPKIIEELKAAAPALSIELSFVAVQRPEQFGPALSAAGRAHAQILYVIDDALFAGSATTLLGLASHARIPVIYASKEYANKGALMFYGANLEDQCGRAARYVDKILKGAKPSDLPIEQPTKFELVVNLKTAKAFGLKIPESILLRADEVIR